MQGELFTRLSWLCETQTDRERVLDMETRIKPLRTVSFTVLAVALLLCGPWVGWWTLAPLAAAGLGFAASNYRIKTSRHPEYRLAAAWLIAELAIAASVALTGGPSSAAVDWLVLPVVTLAARFSHRGVLAGTAAAAVLMLASTLGVHPGYVIAHPQYVVFGLALLGGVAVLSLALMRSDLQHRNASVIDQLTQLLNRNALMPRIDELRHQAQIVNEPIGVILGDLDHFKKINDSHGHAAGDAVLADVAYSLRKHLRAFDLAYRLGGEEFLVLLPGADTQHAIRIAEELRAAIAARPHGGLPVTISFGVTASSPGHFDYQQAISIADQALYHAKATGRNQVQAVGPTALASVAQIDHAPLQLLAR